LIQHWVIGTVHSTITRNCFLGLCQNPIDPYIIWKLRTWGSH
jgi:hypothetical protein